MFGLPKNFPFDKLIGAELVQVCVGTHDMILRLTNEVSISISSAIEVISPDRKKYVNFGAAVPDVSGALAEIVSSALSHNNRDLEMVFSNGVVLIIFDDSTLYESYVVNVGPERFII